MAGVWSSGGNLNTARSGLAGAGTQGASFGCGGYANPNTLATTENYDGAAWSSSGNLNPARSALAACGSQSAGLSFGGNLGVTYYTATEEYDGSEWSSGGALGTAGTTLAGAGTQRAEGERRGVVERLPGCHTQCAVLLGHAVRVEELFAIQNRLLARLQYGVEPA
jgi:hypothetical protein